MLFKRRKKPDWMEQVRIATWPRRSWGRSAEYAKKRTWRIAASPHDIALGFCFGVFISFTPFFGLHIAAAVLLARAFSVSMIGATLGTFVGNPLTFPFIVPICLALGDLFLGRRAHIEKSVGAYERITQLLQTVFPPIQADDLGQFLIGLFNNVFGLVGRLWEPFILPMFVGGAPLGIIAAVASYFPLRRMIASYQERRQAKIDKRKSQIPATSVPAE